METVIISCGSTLNLDTVQIQKEQMSKVLEPHKNVIFHGEQLREVDAAGLQLIASFTKTLTNLGLDWAWEKPSTVLVQTANRLGMQHILKLSAVQ